MAIDRGAWRFGFAVMADSHVEPQTTGTQPPRSNLRTRAAVAAIERRRPAFTIHLGDLVHPVPGLPDQPAALDAVQALLGDLSGRVWTIPGNHDIGDKPLAWMPAKAVDEAAVRGFAARFGSTFQAFDHGGCRFVLINAPVLNSGLEVEAAQQIWLEQQLAAAHGQRIFLFSHYPPYLLDADEVGHYDNVDPPARHWLLDLLTRHRVEALFAGHVHNLFYDRHGPTEIYVTPSTSFVRRDYSELFRIGPAAEFGRDDALKLGFLWVDVFERGHQVRFVRTADDRASADLAALSSCGVEVDGPAGSRTGREREPGAEERGKVGVFLRHPWCEVVELPHNPPTDEFQRRRVRNDYPLWALWELRIEALRVPLADLADPFRRRRMEVLAERGQRFTGFGFGVPDAPTRELLGRHSRAFASWEVVLPPDRITDAAPTIAEIKATAGLRTRLAPLITSAGTLSGGTNLAHFVGHGFALHERALVRNLFAGANLRAAFDGCVIRLDGADAPSEGIAAAAELARELAIRASVTVGLAPASPGEANLDDEAIARRVAEAALAAQAHPEVEVFLDTFMDVDRGYFVRNGLIDRRCNPRPAGQVLGQLHAQAAGAAPPGR